MARYFKKKGYDNTMRSVTSDDKSTVYGVMGTVGDLLAVGVLQMCDAAHETWCFIAADDSDNDYFCDTKDGIKAHIACTFEVGKEV